MQNFTLCLSDSYCNSNFYKPLVPVLWNLTAVIQGYFFYVCVRIFLRVPKESSRYSCQRTINTIVKMNSELGTKCSYWFTHFWLEMKQNYGIKLNIRGIPQSPLIQREKETGIGGGIRPCHFSALSLCLGHKLSFLLTFNLSFFSLILSHSQMTFTTIICWSCHFIGL